MELKTERLRLRLIDPNDLSAIHTRHSLPEMDRYNTLGVPNSMEETEGIQEAWLLAHQEEPILNYTFAMELDLSRSFIGLFGLKLGAEKYKPAELWFKIHRDYWNKGFATEALKAVIKFTFEDLSLHRSEAACVVNNIGSIKVLKKVGMISEWWGRHVLPLQAGWSDKFEYSLLESDYFL
jgi:ribosomal-protein-alanine N-acetyltransferase